MKKQTGLKFWKRKAGYTIAEVLISTFLFSTFATSIYSLLTLSQIVNQTHDVQTRLSYGGLQTLRTINRELSQTSYTTDRLVITTDGNGNNVVRLQIPVDYDDDGDVTSSSLSKSIEWGAYDKLGNTAKGSGANPSGRWARYSVTNNQLQREVLDSMLSVVSGSSTVICNDVQTFTATQNGTSLTVSLTLQVSDLVGQSGKSRALSSTFSYQTTLRNAPT